MRTYFAVISAIILFLTSTSLFAGSDHSWQGVVVKVIDGDSLLVRKKNKVHEIRLYGIDAPEYGQRYWHAAKAFCKRALKGKRVTVEPVDVDRYGRVVALITCGGELINRQLVEGGYAWVYSRYCRRKKLCSRLKAAQKQAGAARRGLWRDYAHVPPRQWDKRGGKQ